ncbi:MAG: hypothetical protein Q8R25_03665 [bacterium]|nr:hypothetical protein [bacterium]
MFKFQVSADLAKRLLMCFLKFDIGKDRVTFDEQIDFSDVGREMGRLFVRRIGTLVQRARICFGKTELTLVHDGRLTVEFHKGVRELFAVPEVPEGDALIKEFGKEFFAWIQGGDEMVSLHHKAPIEKFVVEGENLIAHLRPYEPPPHDPNFVPAETIE